MLHLTFLGTSSGTPTKFRNVSGLAIECLNPYLSEDKLKRKQNRPWLLIDCGEGTQHQLLQTKLSLHQLTAICITHVHGDHCYGLAGLLSSMAMSGRKSPLKLIAPKAIGKLLDTLTLTTQLYFPFEVQFLAIEDLFVSELSLTAVESPHSQSVNIELSENHTLTIDITKLSHRVDSYAFSLTQAIHRLSLNSDKLLAKGIPAGSQWGKLKYGHDVTLDTGEVLYSKDFVDKRSERLKVVISGDNDNPYLLTQAVEDACLLVHESTYTQHIADKISQREDGINPQHSTAKQVATFANDMQLPYLILTHFSARYQLFDDVQAKVLNMGHIRTEVEQNYYGRYRKQFWLAEDFATYKVTMHREQIKDRAGSREGHSEENTAHRPLVRRI